MEERYEIRGTLGKGGLGAVYRAFDRHLKREVALKRIIPDGDAEDREAAVAQITREAATLSSLQHPHVVTVYDVGVDQHGPFVVMELLTGKSLEDLTERGPLTWQDFRELALQTQEALIAAHDLNLLHLDIKPGNIVLTWLPSGKFQAKLVDFGLSKFAPQPTLQDIEKGDSVYGSIFFMAPEQFERRHLDLRTDLYAMGCVYYHALTGSYPFNGATGPEVMQSHLEHRVTPLQEIRNDLPRWAADWVMWHINRLPEERPADAREALKLFLGNEQTLTQTQTMSTDQPAPEAPRRPRLIIPGVTPPAEAAPAYPAAVTPEPAPPALPVSRPVLLVPGVVAAPDQPFAEPPPQVYAAVPPVPPPVPPEVVAPQPVYPPQPEPAPVQAQPVQAAPQQAVVPQPAYPPQPAPVAVFAQPVQPVPPPPPPPPPVPVAVPVAVPQQIPVAAAVLPAAVPMQPTPIPAPQPLTPPEGSKPSVHTAAQRLATQALQAAQAEPPPEAQVPVVPLAPAAPPPGLNPKARLLATPGAAPAARGLAIGTPTAAPAQAARPQTQGPAGQQGPVVFSGSGAAAKKNGLSNGAKVAIAAILGIVVILLAMLLMSRVSSNKRIKEYNALVALAKETGRTEIPVTKAQIDTLMHAATSLQNNKERPTIYQCLFLAKSTDGTDVDAVIGDFATKAEMTDEIRAKFFEILGQRRNPASVAVMLEYAKNSDRPACASAALTNAKLMAKDEHLPAFLDVVQSASDLNVRRAAEGTAGEILKKSPNPANFAGTIVSAYERQPTPDIRHSLLRLMGHAGGDQAKGIITKALEDSDKLNKLNAALALRNWPDDSMYEPLMDFLEKQDDLDLRSKVFTASYDFLMQPRQRQDDNSEELWKLLARNAKTDTEQIRIIDGVARQKGEWTIAVIEYFADEAESDKVKDRAGKALDFLRERERINTKDDDKDDEKKEKKEE